MWGRSCGCSLVLQKMSGSFWTQHIQYCEIQWWLVCIYRIILSKYSFKKMKLNVKAVWWRAGKSEVTAPGMRQMGSMTEKYMINMTEKYMIKVPERWLLVKKGRHWRLRVYANEWFLPRVSQRPCSLLMIYNKNCRHYNKAVDTSVEIHVFSHAQQLERILSFLDLLCLWPKMRYTVV